MRHILTSKGLEATPELVDACRATPVFAVFLAYLQSRGDTALDLEALLAEPDFESWVTRRLRRSFEGGSTWRELALAMGLLPLPYPLSAEAQAELPAGLFDTLATDRWIERFTESGDGEQWVAAHDVLADQMVLAYLDTIRQQEDAFIGEWLDRGARWGVLESAVVALQRLAGQERLGMVDMAVVFRRQLERHPEIWREQRRLLLQTPLLSLEQVLDLMDRDDPIWQGALLDPAVQSGLGWLARRALDANQEELSAEKRQRLIGWMTAAAPHVSHSNYLLTRGLLLAPDVFRQPALDWIQSRPNEVQTHFLLVAWLKSGLFSDDIAGTVTSWCEAYSQRWQSSFVLKSWLDAGGERVLVEDTVRAWIEKHGTTEDAKFVLKSWLDAGGERGLVEDTVRAWIEKHGTTEVAQFVLKSWLDAGGERGLVEDTARAWIEKHGTTEVAGFVLKSWLDAGGERGLVEDTVRAWIEKHGTTEVAGFVLQSWLDAGGECGLVENTVRAWIEKHGTTEVAGFVLQSWLDAGGECGLVENTVRAWIEKHGTTEVARFVLKSWLDAGGERGLVEDTVRAWIEKHGTIEDAKFVLQSWLDAGGERDHVEKYVHDWLKKHNAAISADFVLKSWLNSGGQLIGFEEYVRIWLEKHKTTSNVDFMLKSWLDAGGERGLVEEHVRAWLTEHATAEGASFVLASWLKSGGSFDAVREAAFSWLAEHKTRPEAAFVTHYLAIQPDLPVDTVGDILDWCQYHASSVDAMWRFSRLRGHLQIASLKSNVVATATLLLQPVVLSEENLDDDLVQPTLFVFLSIINIFGSWSGSRSIRRPVDEMFAAWIRRADSFSQDFRPRTIYQRRGFALKFTELLQLSLLDIDHDRRGIADFLHWVNRWQPKAKLEARPILDWLRQRYPQTDLWDIVRYEDDDKPATASPPS